MMSVGLRVANFIAIRNYVILYADDIVLLAPSVTILESMLTSCVVELTYLDMAVNYKKSCCLAYV